MKKVFLYISPDGESPFLRFLSVMEPKLRTKLVQGIGNLAAIPEYRTEPHVKHFSLERYAALYEYRARMRIMVRVIFTLDGDGNIILLHPMVKKQDRNTMQTLETSLRMLDRLKQGEASLVEYTGKEVVG
ncbi:MAG: hypothetical protein HFF11_05310 [Angelakisella sp.]|jgi:phage-related protein|nr:hypothetical protein [Angelakisella sp.]